MKFKVKITGGSKHFKIDCTILTDDFERVDRLKKFADRNNYQFCCEVNN